MVPNSTWALIGAPRRVQPSRRSWALDGVIAFAAAPVTTSLGVVGVGQQALAVGRPVWVQEERRAHGAALARRAVGVERRRRCSRRRAASAHVERRAAARGRVELEHRRCAPPSKCPTNVLSASPLTFSMPRRRTACCRENVMSGRVESLTTFEIGWPLFMSSKWSPTRRETKICVRSRSRCPRSTVDPRDRGAAGRLACRPRRAGPRRRGRGPRFSAHLSSASLARQEQCARGGRGRWSALRCRCRRPDPVEAAGAGVVVRDGLGGEDQLRCRAARVVPGVSSYQTTHGTVSPRAGEGDVGLDAVARWVDVQRRVAVGAEVQRRCVDALECRPAASRSSTLRWRSACSRAVALLDAARDEDLVRAPRRRRRVSCHATHGTGSAPAFGGAAGHRRVLGVPVGVDVQRRDVVAAARGPGPRGSTCCRRRRSGWRRCGLRRRGGRCWARTRSLHGTVRPAPAKSIDGASASWLACRCSASWKPCVLPLRRS